MRAATPAAAQAAAPAVDPDRLTGRQVAGFVAMVFGMFMAILDIQIVSSSLSEIQAGLAATAEEISWVQTSYLIAEVVMIPLSGFLSRLLSTRLLFVLSAASFTAASAACAGADSIEAMIVFRALQGFLGGAMIPTVFAAAFTLFPGAKRARASVIVGLVATLAPTVGPTLGGYLTQLFSWHWLFLINVVPGILVSLAVWLLVDLDRPDWSLLRGFDVAGLVGMAVFLGSLEYVLEEGPRHDWLEEPAIRNFAIAAALGAIVFLYRTLRADNPIVDLTAFRDRNFAVGSLYSFVLGIGLYGLVYVLPLFLAQVRHLNAQQIGEIMFVTGLAQFVSAPIAGRLSRAIDPRLQLSIGFALLAVSTLMLGRITADWQFHELLVPQILRGAALMMCIIPANSLALGTLPPAQLKGASGLYNLMRNLGGAFGLAGINTAMTEAQALHWNRLAENVNPGLPQVQGYLERLSERFADVIAGDPQAAAVARLAALVRQQALVLSFADAFHILSALFLVAVLAVWLVRRPRQAAPAAH